MAVIFRTSIGMGVLAVILYFLVQGEVVSDSMWWPFFTGGAISGFIYRFGSAGRGTLSPSLSYLGFTALTVIVVLAFVFIGWKAGIGVFIGGLAAGILGTIIVSILRS